MEKLNPNQLQDIFKDVRSAYRILALYQQRILDTVKYIGNQYDFSFQSGWSKFGRGTSNGKTATQNRRGLDWTSFYLYEFNMGNRDINGKIYSFKIVHQADTGYYDTKENQNILPVNVKAYNDVDLSETRLFFVISENDNGCPKKNLLKDNLAAVHNTILRNGSWLGVPYDISRFVNQEEADVVIKEFNTLCKDAFGIDLLSKNIS